MTTIEDKRGTFLRGAGEIAEFMFGDRDLVKSVYPLAPQLPLFNLGRLLCGYSGEIADALSAKAREPVEQRLPMRNREPHKRPGAGRRKPRT